MRQYPAVLSVKAPQAIFGVEALAAINGGKNVVKVSFAIRRVNSFGPTVTEFLFHRPTGKCQPLLIDVRADVFNVRYPNHDWRCIGHDAEALLAFGHRLLRQNALSNVARGD